MTENHATKYQAKNRISTVVFHKWALAARHIIVLPHCQAVLINKCSVLRTILILTTQAVFMFCLNVRYVLAKYNASINTI